MAIIWELDFYSRPLLDENGKKVWELLVCDRDRQRTWVQICPPDRVNSEWLAEQLRAIVAAWGQSPQKIRYFRPIMHNTIARGCREAGLQGQPSRRLFALSAWLQERMAVVYPAREGFQAPDPQPLPLRPAVPPTPVPPPDALRADGWQVVLLPAAELADVTEWPIDFGEWFDTASLTPDTAIPGLILRSQRALAMAGWMSGVDPICVQFAGDRDRAQLCLDVGADVRWRLAVLNNREAIAQGEAFEAAKQGADGVHFLAVQSDPEAERFEGFWLLRQV